MAAAMSAFAVCGLLLESGGVYNWAERLDLGPLRTLAMPAASVAHRRLAPLKLELLRANSITALARTGWSDDPAAAGELDAANATPPPTAVTLPAPPPDKPGVVPETKLVPVPPTPATPLLPLAGAPPLTTTLPDIAPIAAGKQRVVALAGDSMMAVGLSATILRDSPKFKDVQFVKAFKSGTGLARPEVFNWQMEYPAMLHGVHPDVVLVAIGANDGQGFVENGVTYPFGSDGWKRVYQQRVQAYLNMLLQPGTEVVWLGLPPMKSGAYDQRIALVNQIAYTVVEHTPGATWFSTSGLIGDEHGGFRDFGEIGGKTARMRAGDGIHLSDEGATLIADKLLPWLFVQAPAPVPAATAANTPQASDKKP